MEKCLMRKSGKFIDDAIIRISLELYGAYEMTTFFRIQPNSDPFQEFFRITGHITTYPVEATILIREN